ncbi:hypothetical protein C2869_06690 [Saccharobesus litoralis]|uniref:DUF3325 domain-containing protein n=1 Tax=Saccharobesus litoralis TaxID=2172099 RepID=A0A2S0VPL1_9ALTE|nr:hypothetical protein C2869_06690 [Saccharobesus litoralis]
MLNPVLYLFGLTLIGFCLLSLSLPRHYQQVTHRQCQLTNKAKLIYRWLGYSAMGLAIVIAVWHWGGTLGLVYWCGLATLACWLISLVLSYRPHLLRLLVFGL